MADELGLGSLAPQRGWEALRAIAGRSRSRGRATRRRRRLRSRRLKKNWPTLSPRKRRAVRRADRDFRHRRTPDRAQAGDPTSLLGACRNGRSPTATIGSIGSMSPPSFRLPLASLLVRLQRRVEAVLRGAVAPLRRRGRRGTRPRHRSRARQCGLAWRAGLAVPDGLRLVFLPPYSPELQPAETLWTLVDEPIVNRLIPTLDELERIISARCAALADRPAQNPRQGRLPLVAQNRQPELITRKSYEASKAPRQLCRSHRRIPSRRDARNLRRLGVVVNDRCHTLPRRLSQSRLDALMRSACSLDSRSRPPLAWAQEAEAAPRAEEPEPR